MRIPPLKIMILLESNPLKSRILVGRLAVICQGWGQQGADRVRCRGLCVVCILSVDDTRKQI